LAWFAIKQVLNAIQNDYKLYTTFNTALNDITEMTVLVQTYDKISKPMKHKAEVSSTMSYSLVSLTATPPFWISRTQSRNTLQRPRSLS